MQGIAFMKKKDDKNALNRGYRINVTIRRIEGG
jgi:hypothetical protein